MFSGPFLQKHLAGNMTVSRRYGQHALQEHLLKPNDLPLLGLRVQRQVRVLHLANLQRPGLDLPTRHRPLQVVRARLHREVGQRDVVAVARRHRRRAFSQLAYSSSK